MKRYSMANIIAMVHYPPDEKFTEDRKYFTNMDAILEGDWKKVRCFTLKYDHHYFHNSGQVIELGMTCVCGKETYNG